MVAAGEASAMVRSDPKAEGLLVAVLADVLERAGSGA
jgi:hypothetical protein